FLDRKTVWVVDGRIPLGNTDNFAAIFFREKFGSVIAHIPEALKDNSLSLQPRRQSQFLQVIWIPKSFTYAELDSSTRRFASTMDPTLRNRLTCDAGEIVDSAGIKRIVGVRHPRHFALARADVRSRNIFARTDVTFADQFSCKSARDFLDLLFVVLLWIETNAAF